MKGIKTISISVLALSLLAGSSVGVTAQDDLMDSADIRILHGADAPAIDIYANGTLAVEALAFGENTGYVPLPGGQYQIQIVPAGTGLDDPANIVVDETIPFEDGTKTTIIATGNLEEGIVPNLVSDTPAAPADMTQIKVGHMSWDAPAVDIALDDGGTIFLDLAFPVATEYKTLPGGAWDLEARLADDVPVVLDIPEFNLDNGVSYSAYAIGSLANESLIVVPLVDMDTPAAND